MFGRLCIQSVRCLRRATKQTTMQKEVQSFGGQQSNMRAPLQEFVDFDKEDWYKDRTRRTNNDPSKLKYIRKYSPNDITNEPYYSNEQADSSQHLTALNEDDLSRMSTNNTHRKISSRNMENFDPNFDPYQQNSYRNLPIKNFRWNKEKVLASNLTEDNQHKMIQDIMLPLLKKTYRTQLRMKQAFCFNLLANLRETLTQRMEAPLLSCKWPHDRPLACYFERVYGSPNTEEYRNCCEFSVSKGVDGNCKTVGFFVGSPSDEHMRCVPADKLVNISESMKKVALHFQQFIRQSKHDVCLSINDGGVWRNLVVRDNSVGDLMATVVVHPASLSRDDVSEIKTDLEEYFFNGDGLECGLTSMYYHQSIAANRAVAKGTFQKIAGESKICEKLLDMKFHIGPDTFFPANTSATEVLFNAMFQDLAGPSNTLVDLCCGGGTYGLLMCPDVRYVIGVDECVKSIEDARQNAAINHLSNCQFIHGSISNVLRVVKNDLMEARKVVAILNPPSGYTSSKAIQAIREIQSIEKLVFISSNPTQAFKNYLHLSDGRNNVPGTPLVPIKSFSVDTLPHTQHQTVVILFQRVHSQQ